MSTRRTHAVETDPTSNEYDEPLAPVALCGLTLISQFAWMMGPSAQWVKGEMAWDDYVKLRRKVRVYPDGERPWYTVSEFSEGEDGSDDIDCAPCRKLLQAALDRYWGKT